MASAHALRAQVEIDKERKQEEEDERTARWLRGVGLGGGQEGKGGRGTSCTRLLTFQTNSAEVVCVREKVQMRVCGRERDARTHARVVCVQEREGEWGRDSVRACARACVIVPAQPRCERVTSSPGVNS